jgi:cytochrome c
MVSDLGDQSGSKGGAVMTRWNRLAIRAVGVTLGLSGLWISGVGTSRAASPLQPSAGTPATCADPVPVPLTGTFCADLAAPEVSCRAWSDVEGGLGQSNLNTVQQAADLFSWQQFLALAWPAGAERGTPDRAADFAAPGSRVWETWKEASEIYLPDGQAPPPWNAARPMPSGCGGVSKLLPRTTKVDDVVDAVLQALPADGTLPATLKDQDGRLVRYEVLLNRPLFDAITSQRLYDGEVQARAERIDFPVGSQLLKAAWRAVGPEEAPFFHTVDACVCDDGPLGQPRHCRPERMGLAGWHLMTRTASAPQWIWSTFEQVDNVVATHGAVSPLNDPLCPEAFCPPNRQTPLTMPNQVRRVIRIPGEEPDCSEPRAAVDDLVTLNGDVQTTLADLGSVFQSYELVGTQWARPWSSPGSTPAARSEFDVFPTLLANTTMETFSQETSTCMGCHSMARTLDPRRFVSSDFSFTLNNAEPRPRGALCDEVEASVSCSDSILPPPDRPRTAWEREHWATILAGFRYTTETYELVGPRYVRSKLHCESCHLNGGGNRDAAWWVGMWDAYDYPHTTRLQDRINGCFERSMNGRAVCSTAGGSSKDCDDSPIMRGLIDYMGWLTHSYDRHRPHGKPAQGYPEARVAGGDTARGARVFAQKCAFCHGVQGQGRYESDTYFRPALWGPDSFNACAGMAQAKNFVPFVRWNMPYTSGGLLTDREANDLAAFVLGQCRPGKGGVGPDGEPCSLTPACVDGVQPRSGPDAAQGSPVVVFGERGEGG